MNFIKNNSGVIAVIALIIAVIGVFTPVGKSVIKSFGATPQNCGGTVTCFTDLAVNNFYNTAVQYLGGSTLATSYSSQVVTGTCATASTTLFAIANPYSATSTATSIVLFGTQGATTTDMVVGTSTTAFVSGAATNVSTVNANFLALTSVATSTQFYFVSGDTKYSFNEGTTTTTGGVPMVNQAKITLAPGESLVGYSTSTWSGSGNGNASIPSIPTSCTYKVEFRK